MFEFVHNSADKQNTEKYKEESWSEKIQSD